MAYGLCLQEHEGTKCARCQMTSAQRRSCCDDSVERTEVRDDVVCNTFEVDGGIQSEGRSTPALP